MSIHTLDKANLINELQCGQNVGQAIQDSRRADFALLLAMLSDDVRDHTPVERLSDSDNHNLRAAFSVPDDAPLRSNQETYARGIQVAEMFNHSGLVGAKLQNYLTPDALAYLPEETHNLPEEVYHNLSGHQRRQLSENYAQRENPDLSLYNSLIINQRQSQIQIQL